MSSAVDRVRERIQLYQKLYISELEKTRSGFEAQRAREAARFAEWAKRQEPRPPPTESA